MPKKLFCAVAFTADKVYHTSTWVHFEFLRKLIHGWLIYLRQQVRTFKLKIPTQLSTQFLLDRPLQGITLTRSPFIPLSLVFNSMQI